MSDREIEYALPMRFYRDPSDCVDEMRELSEHAKRKAERDRINKGRRIRALVKQVMKGERR